MKKLFLFLLLFFGISFAATNTGNIRFSTSLNSDSTAIVGESIYFSGANTYYSGLVSLGGINVGWASISALFEEYNGTSAQTFDLAIRYWDEDTGYGDWIIIGNPVINEKFKLYISNDQDIWEPASGVQFRVISSGTGTATHKLNMVYN